MNGRIARTCWISLLLSLAGALSLRAAPQEESVNLAPIYEGVPGQPQLVSDGSKGAIVTWADRRRGSWDIYAQRMAGSGGAEWGAACLAVCSEEHDQQSPQIASDGAGGAIIVWRDSRSGEGSIYAQRVSGKGILLWPGDGIVVCPGERNQQAPQLVADGAGGAIVVWADYRAGNYDIYAQRIGSSGERRWHAGGVALCAEPHEQRFPRIVLDGAGGAIVVWEDQRGGSWDIYAARVDGTGFSLWARDGAAVCAGLQDQFSPQAAPDGAGGAVIAWVDGRSAGWDIYAQRLGADGNGLWPLNGIGVCTAYLEQVSPQLVPDGARGAIVTWADRRSGSWDIYAAHVDTYGAMPWGRDGMGICTAEQDQFAPRIVSDDAGGAIIAWMDFRAMNNNIFAQRVRADGAVRWTPNGKTICFERHDQRYPQIVPDGAGGAVIAWEDFRARGFGVYAQRVNGAGLFRWAANGRALCPGTQGAR